MNGTFQGGALGDQWKIKQSMRWENKAKQNGNFYKMMEQREPFVSVTGPILYYNYYFVTLIGLTAKVKVTAQF